MKVNFNKTKTTKIFILFSVVLLLFAACNKRNKDTSISMKELKEKGIPDCNKIWSSNEYGKAYSILMNIKNQQPYKLPRKGSKKSGEVFDRLINPENMSFLQNDSIPLNIRAQAILRFLGTYEDIIDIYSNILMKKQYYTPELVDIYLFGLDIMQEMLVLGEKINQSDDPDDIAFQKGFPAIQQFYITMLLKHLKVQINSLEYSNKELETLCNGISTSINKNLSWFDQAQKDTLKQEMQTVINTASTEKIKTEYETLVKRFESEK